MTTFFSKQLAYVLDLKQKWRRAICTQQREAIGNSPQSTWASDEIRRTVESSMRVTTGCLRRAIDATTVYRARSCGSPRLAMPGERIAERISIAEGLRNQVGEARATGIVFQREAEPVCCRQCGAFAFKTGLALCVCKANSLGVSLVSCPRAGATPAMSAARVRML